MDKESENKISLGANLYDMNKQIMEKQDALTTS